MGIFAALLSVGQVDSIVTGSLLLHAEIGLFVWQTLIIGSIQFAQ